MVCPGFLPGFSLAVAARIPVRLRAIDVQGALELACTRKIYAYDAYFLWCAKDLGCPLLTLDKQMRRIAGDLGIRILE